MSALLKDIGTKMTCRLMESDGPELQWWVVGRRWLAVELAYNNGFPTVHVPNNLANTTELERLGARRVPRPRRRRSTPPLYD